MKTRYPLVGFLVVATVVLIACGTSLGTESTADEVSADVVATIGPYTITKEQLKTRLLQEMRPQREDSMTPRPVPTAESVLRLMVAEKAMAMDGRAAGYLKEEVTADSLERTRQSQLIPKMLVALVDKRVPVSDEQIDEALASNPQLTREQAKRQVQNPKVQPILQAFYSQLLEKYHVRKVTENFAKAAEIHQRLLNDPASPRGINIRWITNAQVRDDLSQEEKDLVLATYDGGKITIYDWFKAVCRMAPPSRPKDLGTAAGVGKLVDSALQPLILVAEARAQGFDKDPEYVREMRQIEDRRAMSLVQGHEYDNVAVPTDEETKAYFDAHKELFGGYPILTMDEFWCQDRQEAEGVRKMLDDGASTEDVTEAHSDVRAVEAIRAYSFTEGVFWDKLSAAEPNSVVGPVRGFHPDGIRWRVVRILEKSQAPTRPFDENMKRNVQSALRSLRFRDHMAAYRAQLLEKYPHTMYADRIADIDPLEVTPVEDGDDAST